MTQRRIETWGGYRLLCPTVESGAEIQQGLETGVFDGIILNPYIGWSQKIGILDNIIGPLKSLGIPYADRIGFEAKFIGDHPELEYILLAEYSGEITIGGNNLNELRVEVTPKMKFDLMPSLKSLYIKPTKNTLQDLKGLCPILESLHINNGPIESLNAIETFRNLTKLELTYLARLRSIAGLEKLDRLKVLLVEAARNIRDLAAVLPNIQSLRELALAKCGELEDLFFLDHLQLADFRCLQTKIKNKDLSVLEKIPIHYVAIGTRPLASRGVD